MDENWSLGGQKVAVQLEIMTVFGGAINRANGGGVIFLKLSHSMNNLFFLKSTLSVASCHDSTLLPTFERLIGAPLEMYLRSDSVCRIAVIYISSFVELLRECGFVRRNSV